CLERVAMLARHRDSRPFCERHVTEKRILAQLDAIGLALDNDLTRIETWWEKLAQDQNPYALWAVLLALGCLDGETSIGAVSRIIQTLEEPSSSLLLSIGAEALAIAPHPAIDELGKELLRSASSPARALGVELIGRRGGLSTERVLQHIGDA